MRTVKPASSASAMQELRLAQRLGADGVDTDLVDDLVAGRAEYIAGTLGVPLRKRRDVRRRSRWGRGAKSKGCACAAQPVAAGCS